MSLHELSDEQREIRELTRRFADEVIVPDFTLGPMARRKDTCDLFIEEVAAQFR